MLYDETLTMAITVVSYQVVFAPVRNPPSVSLFTLQVDVPPPLPQPLIIEYLPLIVIPMSSSGLVEDKEDGVVVEFHQNKWKEYLEVTELKYVPFGKYQLKAVFGESIFTGSPIAKNMTRLNLFLEIFPRDQLNLIITLTNAEL